MQACQCGCKVMQHYFSQIGLQIHIHALSGTTQSIAQREGAHACMQQPGQATVRVQPGQATVRVQPGQATVRLLTGLIGCAGGLSNMPSKEGDAHMLSTLMQVQDFLHVHRSALHCIHLLCLLCLTYMSTVPTSCWRYDSTLTCTYAEFDPLA